MEKIQQALSTLQNEAKDYEVKITKREEDLSKREQNLQKEKKEMAQKAPVNGIVIELNVGGCYYTTLKSTLCKFESTFLEAMFSGRHPQHKDSQGRYVIDRDGPSFAYILNFLRTGNLIYPDSSHDKKQLDLELDFYGLTEFAVEESFQGSTLLSDEHKKKLMEWNNSFGKPKAWKLIYKASVDGFGAGQFHQKCNNKGATISVIRSANGNLFGGFTSKSWTSCGGYVADPQAWIFSLTRVTKHLPTTNVNNAIYDNGGYGPTFGGGHDLCIANGSNANTSSYTNFGSSYDTSGVNDTRNHFAGSYNFQTTEIEVFDLE